MDSDVSGTAPEKVSDRRSRNGEIQKVEEAIHEDVVEMDSAHSSYRLVPGWWKRGKFRTVSKLWRY
jgi:hypothetical protein